MKLRACFLRRWSRSDGLLLNQIVDETGNVVRQERCSEHIVMLTVEAER